MASKRAAPASENGAGPGEEAFVVPDDALVIVRQEGEFGYIINGASTVPTEAWPTVLRRMATLIERRLVES
jgi:hypothetical protein